MLVNYQRQDYRVLFLASQKANDNTCLLQEKGSSVHLFLQAS